MHAHRTDELTDRLARHGFALPHMAREPLDVLLSILHCSAGVPETALGVNGEGGDESAIVGRSPQDPAFLQYARGPRARVPLSIAPQLWNGDAPAVRLRYEDLVADTEGSLAAAIAAPGLAPTAALDRVVQANAIDRLRVYSTAFFWRGTPRLWRRLLTGDQADAIRRAHPPAFCVDYACDPDPAVTARAAEERWGVLSPSDMFATRTALALAAAHPAAMLPCPGCGASVKGESLVRHLAKTQGGSPALRGGGDTTLA